MGFVGRVSDSTTSWNPAKEITAFPDTLRIVRRISYLSGTLLSRGEGLPARLLKAGGDDEGFIAKSIHLENYTPSPFFPLPMGEGNSKSSNYFILICKPSLGVMSI